LSQDDIVKVRINQQQIGIVGLKRVVEEMAAEAYGERPDEEVREELLKRLSKGNYIPHSAREAYGEALLREFNKSLGRPYEEPASEGLEIKVLGPGCDRCDKLEMDVMDVAAEMNLPAAVDHIRDIKEIGSYGVMGTPALVIDGKVVSVGAVPSKEKIRQLLSEYA
jgi:small redox-active disulfide protein 2